MRPDARDGAPAHSPGRVLIVVQNLPVPFDRRVWLEATTLARNGYRVTVICPKMKGLNRSREVIEDVEVFRYALPFVARGRWGFLAEFAWCFVMSSALSVLVAVAGRGFDILHVCNPPETFWPLGAFWRLFGTVFLFDHHDLSPEMYAAKFHRDTGALLRGLLFFERMTFRVAQVVVTTNESHRDIALARGGKRAEDVFVVRSGPDLGRLRITRPDAALRRGRPFLIAYLGEICEQDGVEHLVTAMRVLREEMGRTDIQCVLAGGGPHQPEVVRFAAASGVTDICAFTGPVTDARLCEILSSADIGIDPDPKNSWSDKSTMNKVVEYMFFGLPVLAYDLHETRVSAGDAGLYVEPNQPRALAAGIAALLNDPACRAAMGATGQARVRDRLAWSHSVPHLLAAYDRALAKRVRSPPLPKAEST